MFRDKSRFVLSVAMAKLLVSANLCGVAFSQQSQWHIPESAMGVLVVRPNEALQQPAMEMLPRELLAVLGQRELGFDPCQIITATGILETPVDVNGPPPGFAMVLEFDSPQQPGDSLVGRLEKGELKGRTIYRGYNELEPSILQLDPQTIIIGNEPFIVEVLEPAASESPLRKLMTDQPASGQLSAWVVIEPVRDLIRENLPPADQVPPPFAEFLELPDLINNMSASVDMSGQAPLQFQIGTADDASARQAWEIMQRGIAMARSMITEQMMQEMSNEDSDMQNAMRQYANRIGDYFQKNLQPEISGGKLLFESDGGSGTMSVATIGVLTGLLLPAVQQVREAARRTQSMNNLKQLMLAMLNHESANRKLPAQAIVDDDGKPLLSWRVQLLPYLDEQALYDEFEMDESWDSPHNIQLLDRMPLVFRNPNLASENETVYLLMAGEESVFANGKQPQLRDFRDGLSNTLAIVEADMDHAVPWTKPEDIDFDPENPRDGIQGDRPGGFIAALFDGSVQFLTNGLDDDTIRNLVSPDDGNVVRIWD